MLSLLLPWYTEDNNNTVTYLLSLSAEMILISLGKDFENPVSYCRGK